MLQDTLFLSEARRISLAAQGFDRPQPRGPVTIQQRRRSIRQLGLVQIDYVNVLVETAELRPVKVEGWRETAYLRRDAWLPGGIEAASLLSPFGPVVWCRDRVSRLSLDYRVELFVPKEKRKWG